ncbi:MAG: hypothetical protein WBB82_03000 [Limnothrix sp.]
MRISYWGIAALVILISKVHRLFREQAIALAGGLGGATLLALYYIPAANIVLMRRKSSKPNSPKTSAVKAEMPTEYAVIE